jgi:uncharacterized membrane protein (UPF0127 family)
MKVATDERRQPNPSRRGATMIDREPLKRPEDSGRKPQIAAADGLLGWAGRPKACLIRRSDHHRRPEAWYPGKFGSNHAAGSVSFEEAPLTIDAKSGQFEFQVEMAVNPEQRGQGLMFREDLAEDRGMLFDFGRMQRSSMWMRNTYVPLDMLFIHADGRIMQIASDVQPLSDAVIVSREPVRAVLELRAGVAAKLGIEPGDRLVHPMFVQP